MLLSLVIIGLWSLSTYVLDESFLTPLTVSDSAMTMAGAALLAAVLAMLLEHKKRTRWTTAVIITLLALTLLLSIASTGNLESPYVPLWVIVALLAAVAGLWSFLPVCVGLAGYALLILGPSSATTTQWVTFALVIVFPLIVGFILWSRRFRAQDRSNQAMSRLARQLSNESSKSEIVINAIADGVIVIDTDNIIQLINPAATTIIGWGKEDATNLDYRSVLKIIDDKDEIVSEQLDPVQQCLSTNQNVITDKFGIRTVSGKQLLASILVSPISETGSGVIVVFRDITAQRAEERGQAEFISTASHEMRTPVAAIEGYLGLALNPQTATIDDKARMYLGKAHESAQHLGQLFQDLLDVSKAEDGRLNSKLNIINVTEHVQCIVEDFESQAKEKGLELIYGNGHNANGTQTIEPLYFANVDTTHLKEIVSNLITNALKYSKEGTVKVEVNGDNSHVFISVSDTGIGIPAEDLPHLFQKFYRVDNTDTREIGGTGLGLYLSRRLAESMDGHLNVESTYGKGSTFTLDIPRASKEAAAEASQAAISKPAPKPPTATAMDAIVKPVAAPNPAPAPPASMTSASPQNAPLAPAVAAVQQPVAAAAAMVNASVITPQPAAIPSMAAPVVAPPQPVTTTPAVAAPAPASAPVFTTPVTPQTTADIAPAPNTT